MKFHDIVFKNEILCGTAAAPAQIRGIAENPRFAHAGDVLFCHKMSPDIAKEAESAGVCAIVTGYGEYACENIPCFYVENLRASLALAYLRMAGNPQKKLRFIGITGTNGKSTVCLMISHILRKAGYRTGIIGTLFSDCGDGREESAYTTPPPAILARELARMCENGIDTAVMEVSSHALAQERVYGIDFDIGVFTNLTHDHLDFHGDAASYSRAKEKLFSHSRVSLINADDGSAYKIAWAAAGDVFYYGEKSDAEFYFENEKISVRGSLFDFHITPGNISHTIPVKILPVGRFNIYNAAAALACAYLFGVRSDMLGDALCDFPPVTGRMERIYSGDFDIISDYAHTPDALCKAIENLREIYSGKIITLFGCGGERDKTKRPEMGEIATRLSDMVIVTSDNPRSENPDEIIRDILAGIAKENYITEKDRAKAIAMAIDAAKKGDVILLAGKGHENYIIDKNGKHDFCERETALKIIKEKDL